MNVVIKVILFIVLFLLIAMVAFFSFSETAIASINPIKIKTILDNPKNEKQRKQAARVLKFTTNFNENITSMIIIENVIDIMSTTLSTALFHEILPGSVGYFISFVVMTIVIIIFAELIPKMLAKKYAEVGAMKFSWTILVVNGIMKPVTFLLSKMIKEEEKELLSSDDEIMFAIGEAVESGVTSAGEQKIINRVLKLDEIKVSEIFLKSDEVISIPFNANVDQIRKIVLNNTHTRYPMLDEKGNVMKIFSSSRFIKDILNDDFENIEEYEFDFTEFTKESSAAFVFQTLKQNREKMGVVNDGSGNFIGVVTLEDVNELILGEMYDENDIEADGVYETSETSYLVKPHVNVDYFFNEYLKEDVIEEEFKKFSIANWAKKNFEIKLKSGEHFTFNNNIIWIKEDNYNKDEIVFEIDVIK